MTIDIFTYFDADHVHIRKLLHELIANYDRLSPAQVLDRAERIFEAIRVHFNKQEVLLVSAIANIPELAAILEDCSADRNRILSAIIKANETPIDRPEFNERMKYVLHLIEDHVRFSDKALYEQIQEKAPPELIQAVNDRLSAAILS